MTKRTVCAAITSIALASTVVFSHSFSYEDGPSTPHRAGAAEAWHRIQKLRTSASVMHTTAHPDDEHAGVLTRLSRGDGARLALLTLNRGESGDNAIGPQLFDSLGLIRTEELVLAGRYYGVDDQYFTTVIDYGFSKRLEEAFDKWGREQVLRDVVRIIRMNRPWVLVSRFQGNDRDGHGNHQAAGLITQLAFEAAGDPKQFPEQIGEGLQPWQPFKLYIGGVREQEGWSVRIDSGEYSPWLGDSYENVGRYGLSLQRSQTAGRFNPGAGPTFGYYVRAGSRVTAPDKEASIFDGLETTHAGLPKVLNWRPRAGVSEALARIDAAVQRAVQAFSFREPSGALPALVDGLRATREVIAKSNEADEAVFVLRIKERQFQEAINAALGLELTALAQPADVPEPTGPFAAFVPPPTMTAPVPGQTFEVRVRLANRGGTAVTLGPSAESGAGIGIDAADGWSAVPIGASQATQVLNRHEVVTQRFNVTLADGAAISTKPYFTRSGIQANRYTLIDPSQFGRPASTAPLVAVARFTVGGEVIEAREVVKRRESKPPYGDVLREVRSVPRLALTASPAIAVIPLSGAKRDVTLDVEVVHNGDSVMTGAVSLTIPPGWTSDPREHPFTFRRSGERARYQFSLRPASVDARSYNVAAVARAAGAEYREGYELIDERDLEVRYLYRPSSVKVQGIDVSVVQNLTVGYVMGVGDQVPAGLRQLGVNVVLLGDRELAAADLSRFDAIMTGTRAYAVREDLKTYNQRLLEYVKGGGNLIVLYNTQEFVPASFAPFPGELPRNAEEVSEEDSLVEILAPDHQAFTWPNRITKADFEGWVEQRGSKFFTTWDAAYTPMIATYDKGQAPQRGGWLTARHGKGTWTYFAYALHRQLPYGVPGAYRIVANLLALGKAHLGSGR